jgi:transportin-3
MVDLQCHPAVSRCTPCGEIVCCANVPIKSKPLCHFSSCRATQFLLMISQVTFDLSQVDQSHLLPLRDTLLTALERYQTGPRSIIVQLCLAISGLALQLPAWDSAVQSMIDSFGRNPATVPTLLQFLTLLPEELNGNTRIPVTVCRFPYPLVLQLLTKQQDDEYRDRSANLLTANAKQVLDILSMYIQATGDITSFWCL